MLILDSEKRFRPDFSLIDLQNFAEDNESGNPVLWITRGLEAGAYEIVPAEFFL